MPSPEDPTYSDVSHCASKRRRVCLLAGTAIAAGVAAGITYAVLSTTSDALVPVRGHIKWQAVGAGWSEHRPIEIAPYLRRPPR
jgi:hypothetical protein